MIRYAAIAALSLFLIFDVGVKSEAAYRHRITGWTFVSTGGARLVRIRFLSFGGERSIETANQYCYENIVLDAPLHGNCY